LAITPPPADGLYRSISSRIINGLPLGPAPERGVRPDDPNDWFPHQNRRVLRGLKVFCSLTNMCCIGPSNTLDIYTGLQNKGYIKHYIVDFDDALGTHAARTNQHWAGFNRLFSFKEIITNFITVGFNVPDWGRIKNTPWKSVGSFESDIFEPNKWKEIHPYAPIQHSLPSDNYWAAKILGALTQEHIAALINAADYPETGAAQYMIETLMKRRQKLLTYYLDQVTPVEVIRVLKNHIECRDMKKFILNNFRKTSRYTVHFLNDHNKEIAPKQILTSSETDFTIDLTQSLVRKTEGYIILKINNFHQARSPVFFHLRAGKDNKIKLVGVIH
jgi:hypothetical protein